jgi:hypothetical protein
MQPPISSQSDPDRKSQNTPVFTLPTRPMRTSAPLLPASQVRLERLSHLLQRHVTLNAASLSVLQQHPRVRAGGRQKRLGCLVRSPVATCLDELLVRLAENGELAERIVAEHFVERRRLHVWQVPHLLRRLPPRCVLPVAAVWASLACRKTSKFIAL